MPELPEVETTRRGLQAALKGRRIEGVEARSRALRFPLPKNFEGKLEGRHIMAVRRRAKYLLFDLDSGDTILAHLGMSGSFRLSRAEDYEPRKHDHVIWQMEDERLVIFHDPRRFGLMDIVKKGRENKHKLLAHLGPEPLGKDFSAAYLAARLARRNGPIKPALMDQTLVVGVGNIYASESLFLAGVHPATVAKKIITQAPSLIKAIHATLNAAIDSGGSTLRDYVGADGEVGYFQHHFNVYERAGKPCARCGTKIKSSVQAGRSTYWCPRCQRTHARSQKR